MLDRYLIKNNSLAQLCPSLFSGYYVCEIYSIFMKIQGYPTWGGMGGNPPPSDPCPPPWRPVPPIKKILSPPHEAHDPEIFGALRAISPPDI